MSAIARSIRFIIVAAVIAVVAAGCTNNSDVTPPPASPTTTPSQTTATMDTAAYLAEVEAAKAKEPEMVAWATSPERAALYLSVYEPAKYRLANEIEKRTFGEPLIMVKEGEWRKGLSGSARLSVNWGRENTGLPAMFVDAWITPEGTIDYTKGVTGMYIDAGRNTRGVIVYDKLFWVPADFRSSGKQASYELALDELPEDRGLIRITSAEMPVPADPQRTKNVDELTTLDKAGIMALDANMTALFGPDWNND